MPRPGYRDKVATIVGEINPYGGNDDWAMYPAPNGCSGHRLCCLIFGMRRTTYLRVFKRTNLCLGNWSMPAARDRVRELGTAGKMILCGSKVAAAFLVPFTPFEVHDDRILVLPHPSGRNTMWNDPSSIHKARLAVIDFCPSLLGKVGVDKADHGFEEWSPVVDLSEEF